ncbi:hypothetical protein GHT06_012994 [Daphnia sinensis]|uniref:Uncharacterized protein n=1 Tax=Daphnia sinensis TaxID=1820382 RepID=A0AAD5KYM1_9CRUS|nr:hypothetical protein GHT06_012994 [Daphnia sinensis]
MPLLSCGSCMLRLLTSIRKFSVVARLVSFSPIFNKMTEMSVKYVTCVSIILAISMLANKLQGAAIDPKAPEQPSKANPLNILSFLSDLKYSIQAKSLNETLASCPSLWTQTEKEFSEKEETGILGSITKLQELCPAKENLTLVCKGAIWISDYVCTASQVENHQPPAVQDLKNLTNVSGLCQALVGNVNLTQKLCDIVKTRVKSDETLKMLPLSEKFENICTLPGKEMQEQCIQYCGENKQPLCKIILQSLRTIVSLEEKKEHQLAETSANADTDLSAINGNSSLYPSSLTDPPVIKTTVSVPQSQSEQIKQGMTSQNNKGSINSTTQSISTVTPITINNEKPALSGDSDISVVASNKTHPKSPSTQSTDIDASSATEVAVTDEDFGLDDFGSADKPPIKPADEDPPSYEDGDDPIKEEKELNKDEERIPNETQKAVQYDSTSDVDADPVNTHFLFYFIAFAVLSASGYLMFMRRKYLIALVLEGRSNSSRRRSSSFRERPSSGSYRKLVNNLEEAITSNSVKNSNVIY